MSFPWSPTGGPRTQMFKDKCWENLRNLSGGNMSGGNIKKKKPLHQSLLSLQHQQDELWTLKDGELPLVKFISVLRVESCTNTEPFRGWMSQSDSTRETTFFLFLPKPHPQTTTTCLQLKSPQTSTKSSFNTKCYISLSQTKCFCLYYNLIQTLNHCCCLRRKCT